MDTIHKKNELFERLKNKIKDIDIAMMTTVEPDGHLRSRPMMVSRMDFDGTLWFFTNEYTGKVDEINHNHSVNLSFENPEKHSFVSVTGEATLIRDESLFRELWNPMLRPWFPEGLHTPHLALIRINPIEAEYWENADSRITRFFDTVKTIFTEKTPESAEHERIEFNHLPHDR
jgi:general stress protein 26